ncbi:hypothetical protein MUK42_06352 [Musa troglodytarum]|uniref:Uncharacterized protein n=1 Tax=Musa troglodytarum TaxID=320322 RepID=A0A9E7GWY6_9LILI|nr:hypothetical protein MUK42_06352 [Musa troglodytarum]
MGENSAISPPPPSPSLSPQGWHRQSEVEDLYFVLGRAVDHLARSKRRSELLEEAAGEAQEAASKRNLRSTKSTTSRKSVGSKAGTGM